MVDRSLLRLLSQLVRFCNIYAQALYPCETTSATLAVPSRAAEIHEVDAPTAAAWSTTLLDGFGYTRDADRDRVETWNRMLRSLPGVSALVAMIAGTPVGAASVMVLGSTAMLGGAATLPAFRRRGVQRALIEARLAVAARAGCELAIVTADLGSSSGRNVERTGFQLICTHVALRLLAENTSALETHRQDVPLSFDLLRRTLARTAQDVVQRYEQGQYQQAHFALQQLTAQCFACHSRFMHPQPFDLGKHFLTALPLAQLPLRDQVRLAVATRQFETAIETCETLFRSTTMTAAAIDLLGVFEDYLKIVLRVREDFARAIATFEQFLGRADVTSDLRERLRSWVEALQELQPQRLTGEALARARALIEAGQRRHRFPADQLGLVHFVVVSSLLHRSVEAQATTTPALVEAYYLLGIAESYISRASWVAETPFFLEVAIRLDPQSPRAVKAYDLLNAYILAAYTGSSGVHLTQEVQEYLEELRRLRQGS